MELESRAEEPPETRGISRLPTDVKTRRQRGGGLYATQATSDRLILSIALVRFKNTWLVSGKKSCFGT